MKITPDFLFSFRLTPRRTFIGFLIVSFISLLSTKCGISQEDILKLYNDIRRVVGNALPSENEILKEIDRQLNEKINRNPELLDYKVRGEVDTAIRAYEREENKSVKINMKNENILKEINKSKYDRIQKLILENAVYYEFEDGTMGIRGAWVAPDPREIDLEQ
jgi:parvulin-like peptidyl-prolyl isomerase